MRVRCFGQRALLAPHAWLPMCIACKRRTDPHREGDQWRESLAYVDPAPLSEHDRAGTWRCKGRVGA